MERRRTVTQNESEVTQQPENILNMGVFRRSERVRKKTKIFTYNGFRQAPSYATKTTHSRLYVIVI